MTQTDFQCTYKLESLKTRHLNTILASKLKFLRIVETLGASLVKQFKQGKFSAKISSTRFSSSTVTTLHISQCEFSSISIRLYTD